MARFSLKPEAISDLREIYAFGCLQFGERLADKYYNDLFDKFEAIAVAPLEHPVVDIGEFKIRRCVFKSHQIYFQIIDEIVDIVAVKSRQDLLQRFEA